MGTGEKRAHGSTVGLLHWQRSPQGLLALASSADTSILEAADPSRPEKTMPHPPLRIGLIGAGANTRLRHIPGLREQENVTLVAVCNRRPSSTAAVARDYGISRTYERWQDLVADSGV